MKIVLITEIACDRHLFEYIHFKPQTDLENGIGEFIEKFKEEYSKNANL